ncbi:MAG: hypothetical protein FJ388_26915 [Verrucomicrobia bacterium]|nr:hypothetical protein [Verrucomicrobiota bacterium]
MEPACSHPNVTARAVAVVVIFMLMSVAIWFMYLYTQPGPVEETRWAERTKNLSDLNVKNKDELENPGWVSKERGVVRLPVARAMELTVKEWQDPAAGRAGLIARMEEALPPMPPAPAAPKPK